MNRTYKALLVDDEPLARKDLKAVLSRFPQIKVVAEADSVRAARECIERDLPDLIFLDIQMPEQTGFDLLPHIPPSVSIIFVTAYDHYAIRAFEVNAQDYLLKPVDGERLALSVARLDSRDPMPTGPTRRLDRDDCLFLRLDTSYKFLKINELVKISAADDYTELTFLNKQPFLVHKTMKSWEDRLPETIFCRVHRSSIINIESVERIEPWHRRSFLVHLTGVSEPVVMSRRYWIRIRDRLA